LGVMRLPSETASPSSDCAEARKDSARTTLSPSSRTRREEQAQHRRTTVVAARSFKVLAPFEWLEYRGRRATDALHIPEEWHEGEAHRKRLRAIAQAQRAASGLVARDRGDRLHVDDGRTVDLLEHLRGERVDQLAD